MNLYKLVQMHTYEWKCRIVRTRAHARIARSPVDSGHIWSLLAVFKTKIGKSSKPRIKEEKAANSGKKYEASTNKPPFEIW